MTDKPNEIVDLGYPDVTEEYTIDHGEGKYKYSPIGGEVGVEQARIDEIEAKEGLTAETAIEGSYSEDAGDGKVLNHVRKQNLGII
jgi:hypothetical protein